MRRVVALLAVLMFAWHGAVPGQTPNPPPAGQVPSAPAEQTPLDVPATSALGPGLSTATLAVLGVIGVILLTTTVTVQCNHSDSCGGIGPSPATATGTR